MFVGVGASRVRDLFQQARKMGRAIIFIDEIDSIGRKRGAGLGGGHDEREQTLNQMLSEMDGFETTEGIVIMAATNRPDILDPALLRPGRFDRQIVVPLPEYDERLAILKVHSRDKRMGPDVDLEVMAKAHARHERRRPRQPRQRGRAVRRAPRLASRSSGSTSRTPATASCMGARRESLVLTAEEKRATAYHEGGHAVLATVLPHADPLHKVTILPRGMALGVTWSCPRSATPTRKEYFEDTHLHGDGRPRRREDRLRPSSTPAPPTTSSRPPSIARRMVREWGMSDAHRPDGVEQPAAGVPRRGPHDRRPRVQRRHRPAASTRRSRGSSASRRSGPATC